jgi:hypothetical protein
MPSERSLGRGRSQRRAAQRLVLISMLIGVAISEPQVSGADEAKGTAPSATALSVLIFEGPTPEWSRRVRGQLSDLHVILRTAPRPWRSTPDLQALRELSQRKGVGVIAWIDTRADPESGEAGSRVTLWFATTERLYTRVVADSWKELSPADRSGALELAALSVRSAVRSLLLDPAPPADSPTAPEFDRAAPSRRPDAPGVAPATRPEAPATSEPPPTPRPEAPARPQEAPSTPPSPASTRDAPAAKQPDRPATRPETSRRTRETDASLRETNPGADPILTPAAPQATTRDADLEPIEPPAPLGPRPKAIIVPDTASEGDLGSAFANVDWDLEAGVAWHYVGLTDLGATALVAGLGARLGRWGLTALGQLGLPAESRVGPARFDVQRHALLLEGHYRLGSFGPITVAPLAQAGVAFLHRSAAAGDGETLPTPEAKSRSFCVGAGARAELRLSEWFALSVRGTANWQSSAPKYEVRRLDGETVWSEGAWSLQPGFDLTGKLSF